MVKEFHWYGKTEEELKQLDMKSFAALLPSRRRRSLQHLTAEHKKILEKIAQNPINLRTHCRDMVIVPALIGKTIKIHNGKEFIPIIITAEMLGHCLGEFALTRKFVSHSAAGIGATRSSKAVSAR